MTRRAETDAAWRQRLTAAGLSDINALLDSGPDELGLGGRWQALSKPGLGGRQRWRWEIPATNETPTVIYAKRYAALSLREHWDRIWRQHAFHSRGWWEYHQAQVLGQAGLPVPRAVGAAEELRGPFEIRSVVLLSAVAGDAFDRVWPQLCQQNAPVTRGAARHNITVKLARLVATFHNTGLCHRDLYLCHIFADFDPQARREPEFAIIDLARTHRPRLRRQRWIIKDLAQADSSARQIGATRTDRLRFLSAYLAADRHKRPLRWYVPRIMRKSDWILRRIARQQQQT